MRVRYTESATSDVEAIYSYIAERNPKAAVAVIGAIEATAARIGLFPYSAQTTDEPNVRMTPAQRYPYLILYTVAAESVDILRVLHGAQLRPWEEGRDAEHEK